MSTHKRVDRIICLAIIISLLLSGMYLDTVTPDDLFVYSSFSVMSMEAPQYDCKDAAVCTTEMLNECAGISMQSEGLSVFPQFFCAGLFLLLQGRFFQNPETIQTFCRTLDALVTEYMHQSDGKKRI